MMKLLVIVGAVIAAANAKSAKYSYKVCSGSNAEASIDSVSFTPATPKFGSNETVTGKGQLSVPVKAGNFEIKVTLAGFQIADFKGDICKAAKFTLPLNGGFLYWDGVTCPEPKGPQVIKSDILLTDTAPNGKYEAMLIATDAVTKNQIFCLDVHVDVSA